MLEFSEHKNEFTSPDEAVEALRRLIKALENMQESLLVSTNEVAKSNGDLWKRITTNINAQTSRLNFLKKQKILKDLILLEQTTWRNVHQSERLFEFTAATNREIKKIVASLTPVKTLSQYISHYELAEQLSNELEIWLNDVMQFTEFKYDFHGQIEKMRDSNLQRAGGIVKFLLRRSKIV